MYCFSGQQLWDDDYRPERAFQTLQPHIFSTIVRHPSLHTFKLINNPIVCNRKPFVAPLRSVLDEFNGLMKLSVRSVVKPVLPGLKFFNFRFRAIFTDFQVLNVLAEQERLCNKIDDM